MSPIDPPLDLHAALVAHHAGQISPDRVLDVLRRSDVYIARPDATGDPSGHERDVEPGELLQLPVIETADGRQLVPLFSSLESLARAVAEDTRYVRVPYQALADAWAQGIEGIVDPGSPVEFHIPAPRPEEALPRGTRIFVGEPAEEPRELLEALGRAFAEEPGIEAAYRAQVYVEDTGEEPHLAIGLLLAPEADRDALFERAAEIARAVQGNVPVGLLVIDPHTPHPVTEHMLHEASPFYRRGVAG
jgi:SseB protein C-terminal domain/SseB protein N-terminal domain